MQVAAWATIACNLVILVEDRNPWMEWVAHPSSGLAAVILSSPKVQ